MNAFSTVSRHCYLHPRTLKYTLKIIINLPENNTFIVLVMCIFKAVICIFNILRISYDKSACLKVLHTYTK